MESIVQPPSQQITEVVWRTSPLVSCLHAAEIVSRGGQNAAPEARELLHAPVRRITQSIELLGIAEQPFWQHVIPLAANLTNMRQLADVVVRKLVSGTTGAPTHILADALCEIELVYRKAGLYQPELLENNLHRLQGCWAGEGQAVLQAAGWMTDPDLVVSRAEVVIVGDVGNGGGVAHLQYNSVRLEALSADPLPELSEILRLVWLISQLHLDVPRFGESIPSSRLPSIAAAAMLPVTLTAAHEMGLAPTLEQTITTATDRWLGNRSSVQVTADLLQTWWNGYRQRRPDWSVALAALNRML